MKPSILAISYAKRTLDPESRERSRMRAYAAELEQYHVIVFTRKDEGFPRIQTDGNLTLYATNSSSKVAMLARAFRIGKEILANDPSTKFIVSSQDPFESSLVGRMLTHNVVHEHYVQVHGDVFNPKSYRTSLLQRIRVWYGKRVVRSTGRIRVVSERIKKSLMQLGVSEEHVVVLPIQPNLQEFLAIGAARQTDPSDPLKLLYIGRLAPEKNIPLLLQACAELKKINTRFTLRIVGDGLERILLEKMTATLGLSGAVTFVGWKESLAEEMAAANIFCLCSNHEGWAMVLQEAAAARMAIITTNVGCAGEFIINQQEGVVTPVGDVSAYTEGLRSLVDTSLRQKLSSAAFEKAQQSIMDQDEYVRRWVASHISD